LNDVKVQDGSLEVQAAGTIVADEVRLLTDRFSNKLRLDTSGQLLVDEVEVGQSVEMTLNALGGIGSLGSLVVVPVQVTQPALEDNAVTLRVDIADPERALQGELEVEMLVDFGDGKGRSFTPSWLRRGG
jgi:hypothetical protein